MMTTEGLLLGCTGFEWDAANAAKNWDRHRVSPAECEEVFFLAPRVVTLDIRHSGHEQRYVALGESIGGRKLFVAFTVRGDRIRVISARPMSRRERRAYAKAREASQEEQPPD